MAKDYTTIDNLNPEISRRYAEETTLVDQSWVQETKSIPPRTEIDTLSPSFLPEVYAVTKETAANLPIASFIPPPNFKSSKTALFTHQLSPNLPALEQLKKTVRQSEKPGKEDLDILIEELLTIEKNLLFIQGRRKEYTHG